MINKLKHKQFEKLYDKSRFAYHKDGYEIVVSEEEMMIQLSNNSIHNNLLMLLIYGRDLQNFETRLTRASLKFEQIGRFVYCSSDFKAVKPSADVYMKELFEGYYETLEEVKERIESIKREVVSLKAANSVYKKLMFIAGLCCLIMSDTYEIWPEHTYRCFIEYAIDNDIKYTEKFSIAEKFLKQNSDSQNKRLLALEGLPKEFRQKVFSEGIGEYYESIWR